MIEKKFILRGGYIELIKLLKLINLAESGAHAKLLVEEGEVSRNGTIEYRKRAKLRSGDIIVCCGYRIEIESDIRK